ncbi:hypothetical protein L198_00874 [Cryptococcus wingfieldii CBS 7118]|uniref:Cell wall protein n=1 Tax=Cryptococcus wingfieldii CBS 7118 TaxID=1295528 RepID=A0A1E3K2N7_9TREE|nr:hypothetical protein L198_00874 [Cryptococcus wingfieldii CBS 7118]ODO07295.1 hypothetical protein L198_00874 [Cryptococcus wingfieldii CBS 7118]
MLRHTLFILFAILFAHLCEGQRLATRIDDDGHTIVITGPNGFQGTSALPSDWNTSGYTFRTSAKVQSTTSASSAVATGSNSINKDAKWVNSTDSDNVTESASQSLDESTSATATAINTINVNGAASAKSTTASIAQFSASSASAFQSENAGVKLAVQSHASALITAMVVIGAVCMSTSLVI